ncbi:hypothetical protein [Marinagarivorans algicola]|uniref:hypothetical protein n=1 Tax=Marinagarivorans algicola TaxID=1513270 RepID=UPI0006B94753|nr:hypothetical protein [Marinagarivorans algicola]
MKTTDIDHIFSTLRLPKPDIELLAFCGGNKVSKVNAWVNNLKTTQTINTCNQLYQAIAQILRLKTTAPERKAMLDELFLTAYTSCLSLGKEFLNQPLSLPEPAQKSAMLGQAILKSLAAGYLLYLQKAYTEKKLKDTQLTQAAEAAHSALQCLALMQLRNQQLYSQATPIIWRYANALIQLTDHLNIGETLVKSVLPECQAPTPNQAYLRIVALAGAQLNQLTQIDMHNVFNALGQWSAILKFSDEPTTFWVDLQQDGAPQSQKRKCSPESGRIIHIDFSALTRQLSRFIAGDGPAIGNGAQMRLPLEINLPTVVHLESAWSRSSLRSDERRTSTHTAEIIIGFQQCHSKLSGVDDFNVFLGDNIAAPKNTDMLTNLMSSLTPADNANTKTTHAFTPLKVTTQNISKDGYCLLWEGSQSVRIHAGDVVIIREHAKRDWGIGVIRWIRQLKQHSILGVQLIDTKPQAVGASCHYKEGGYSDFMRAFLLPGLHSHHNPSLLTANLLFNKHTKVKIKANASHPPVQSKILDCQITTGKVKVFELQKVDLSNQVNSAQMHEL